MYVAGREIRLPHSRPGTHEISFHYHGNDDMWEGNFCSMLDVTFGLAGHVVNLINDSPRVEGNNITVDLQTEHPVQCGLRLATMRGSRLRDCESTSFLLH